MLWITCEWSSPCEDSDDSIIARNTISWLKSCLKESGLSRFYECKTTGMEVHNNQECKANIIVCLGNVASFAYNDATSSECYKKTNEEESVRRSAARTAAAITQRNKRSKPLDAHEILEHGDIRADDFCHSKLKRLNCC